MGLELSLGVASGIRGCFKIPNLPPFVFQRLNAGMECECMEATWFLITPWCPVRSCRSDIAITTRRGTHGSIQRRISCGDDDGKEKDQSFEIFHLDAS